MGDYVGIQCPICEKRFDERDDVVVCPVCGTPYHRACYQREGRCVNEALHVSGASWSPQAAQQREEARYDGEAQRRCGKCGTLNPPEGIFCQICGYPLREGAAADPDPSARRSGPDPIAPNPFTTPYGGVPPDEKIDGVPVREIALFVGDNSHYFIPRFREAAAGRSGSWNWPAFLFHGFYFLYRKMYGIGAALLAVTLVMNLPSILLDLYSILGRQLIPGLSAQSLLRASLLSNGLWLLMSLGCAMFSNRAYRAHVLHTIRKLRRSSEGVPDAEFVAALSRRGRTNRAVIVVALGLSAAAMMSGLFLLAMSVV